MAGVKFDGTAATASLRGLLAGIENPAPLLAQLGEYTLRTTRDRFKTQTGPDGTAWAALQPWYKKEKSQNKNRVLTLRGLVGSPDGSLTLQAEAEAPLAYADALGRAVAKKLADDGAKELIAALLATP